MAFLEGDRVVLRPVEESDLDGPYAEWINDQVGDEYTQHALYPHSAADLRAFYEHQTTCRSTVWLAIIDKDSGRHVGNVELSGMDAVNSTAHFAVLIGDPAARGKGLGFESARLLIAHAFAKLNIHRVELGVNAENAAALALYRKLGFVEEGRRREALVRDGKYEDIFVMGMLPGELAR